MTVTPLYPTTLSLDPAALVDIATGLAQATSLWAPHVHADADQRHSVRLLATDAYEVWVLSWAPGQSVSLHDHGPSAGALVVLEGELTEVTVGQGHPQRAILAEGTVQTLEVGLVHDVLNEGTRDAVSLHVYSPPLSVMGIWDEETMTCIGLEEVQLEDTAVTSLPVHTAVA
jgi:predicted metal-dependent enzyme (double-stranded beta helix superfamily)